MERLKITVEKTGDGYSAYSEDHPGVVSVGDTWEELKENMQEAISFHFEGMVEDGVEVPASYRLDFSLDVNQLFAYYDVFNVSAIARKLGINVAQLHQYKDGHKRASETTSKKIIDRLHDFGVELLNVR